MSKKQSYDHTEAVKVQPVVNYQKVEERVATSYEEAQETATSMFAPYGEADTSGSRTSAEAKVRIRQSGPGNSLFRVILSKHLSVLNPKKEEKPVEEEPQEKKKKAPARGDKKGRRKKTRERKASTD